MKAATAISDAETSGDGRGSMDLTFTLDRRRSGYFRFEIGTAGATTQALQAIYLPLCFADGSSTVTLTGGTHVP